MTQSTSAPLQRGAWAMNILDPSKPANRQAFIDEHIQTVTQKTGNTELAQKTAADAWKEYLRIIGQYVIGEPGAEGPIEAKRVDELKAFGYIGLYYRKS